MNAHEPEAGQLDLTELSETLLEKAKASNARRAAHSVYNTGVLLRQTMVALADGAELSEHESPPEATVHVLSGKVRIYGKDRFWEVAGGELIPVPPERHSVTALADSVFLLTVRRDSNPVISEIQGPKL